MGGGAGGDGAGVTKPPVCRWRYQDLDDYWETSCGKAWSFNNGGTPVENEQRFCGYCGKRIEVVE